MSHQLVPRSKGAVLALACAAQFMVVLDIAIVNVALPSIQQDLGVGQSTLQWVVIAYGLAARRVPPVRRPAWPT